MSCRSKFSIIYASSRDPQFQEADLTQTTSDSQGWLSARFASYPQILVFELEEFCHIKQLQILSHQYAIANKIDVYLAEGQSGINEWKSLSWNRIGYLSLDKNERGSFRSRELKSVYLDHRARYVKLSLRESHVNHINVFNQVGIVAFNVLADVVSKDSIDDLGKGMEYDDKTLEYLQELQAIKRQAVEDEDYDEAKRVKIVIDRIMANKDHLAELELEKKQAVAEEDYDRAKELKLEIETIRSSFNLRANVMVEPKRSIRRSHEEVEVYQPPIHIDTPPHRPRSRRSNDRERNEPSLAFDNQPLPSAIKPLAPARKNSESPAVPFEDLPLPTLVNKSKKNAVPFEDLPLPTLVNKNQAKKTNVVKKQPDEFQEDQNTDFDYENELGEMIGGDCQEVEQDRKTRQGEEPPELTSAARKDNTEFIDLLGDEFPIRCLCDSKNWNSRSEAFDLVDEWWSNGKIDRRDIALAFRESVRIGRVGVNDKTMGVMIRGTNFLTTLVDKHGEQVSRKVILENISIVISEVIVKLLAHNNQRVSDAAANMLHTFALHKKIGAVNMMKKLLKPLSKKQKGKPKPLERRGSVLYNLIESLEVIPDEIELGHMMVLILQQLNHKNGKVREVGVKLCVECYAHYGPQTLRYLKSCSDLMKQTLNKAIADRTGDSHLLQRDPKSDKEINRPSRGVLRRKPAKRKEKSTRKQKKKKKPPSDGYESPVSVPRSPVNQRSPVPRHHEQDLEEVELQPDQDLNEMCYCNFCGEYNPAFAEDDDEEALDVHYFQECPMLAECQYCEQIVETSGLVDHIIEECEAVDQKHEKCPTCRDAFPTDVYYDHVGSKTCTPVPKNMDKCPLCQTFIPTGDESWQQHLCRECPKNERRRA